MRNANLARAVTRTASNRTISDGVNRVDELARNIIYVPVGVEPTRRCTRYAHVDGFFIAVKYANKTFVRLISKCEYGRRRIFADNYRTRYLEMNILRVRQFYMNVRAFEIRVPVRRVMEVPSPLLNAVILVFKYRLFFFFFNINNNGVFIV